MKENNQSDPIIKIEQNGIPLFFCEKICYTTPQRTPTAFGAANEVNHL